MVELIVFFVAGAICLGGALGVDKLMSVKVAKVGEDWVITTKLIDVKKTKVDARGTEFLSGGAVDLMRALPEVVGESYPWSARSGDARSLADVITRAVASLPATELTHSMRARWEEHFSPPAGRRHRSAPWRGRCSRCCRLPPLPSRRARTAGGSRPHG
jgi:hypothetical protein